MAYFFQFVSRIFKGCSLKAEKATSVHQLKKAYIKKH